MGMSTEWISPDVRHVAKGLKNAKTRASDFLTSFEVRRYGEFFAMNRLSPNLPNRPFSPSCSASEFRLKLSSSVELTEMISFRNPPPHPVEAFVGSRAFQGADFLAVRLAYRKNLGVGAILKRPFFCGLQTPKAISTCPDHSLWPAIKARLHPGSCLFSPINRRNFNRVLKSILAKLQVPQADRYSPHAFRRGSAQELNETGAPLPVIASAGAWRSNAVRGYIDLASNVESNVKQLFRVDTDSESDHEVSAFGSQRKSHWPTGRVGCPWVAGISDMFRNLPVYRLDEIGLSYFRIIRGGR